MDIAELGFSVNTQAIQAAEKVLDGFVAKAKSTQATLNSIGGSSRGSSKIVSEASKQAAAIDKSTAATKKLVDSSDKAADSASKAANSLKRWIDGLKKSNTQFMRTNTQLLKMSKAYANLDAATRKSYETTARLADAYKRSGALLQESLSPLAAYKQSLADIAVIEKNGARSAAELATARRNALGAYREALGVSKSTETATQQLEARTRELNAAVKNGSITQAEFTSQIEMARKALLGEATAAERAALAAKQAALAMKEYQSIQSARVVQTVGGLSGGNNLSSAELSKMRRDAQIAFREVETSGRGAMNKIAASTTKTAAEVGALKGSVIGLGNVFKHAFGGLIAFAAVGAITEFVHSIGNANVEMQKILNTLLSATGSMSAARSEFAFLADTANKLGTNLQGSADGYSRLAVSALAAGVSTSQLHKAFTGLSEGFSATGRSGDEMNRFLVQLEQGMSQGTIHMRDLRAMAQSFPAAFELAGEATKRMGGSLQDFLKNGGIPAEQFFLTFSEVIHEHFAEAAKAASQTLVGQLNILKNTLFQLKTGTDVMQPLTDAVKELNKALSSDEGKKNIKDLVSSIVSGFVAAAKAIAALIKMLPELIALLKTAVTLMLFRTAIGGVAKLAGAFVTLTKAAKEFAEVKAVAGVGTAIAGEARRIGVMTIGAKAASSAGLVAGAGAGAAELGAAASAAILPVTLLVAAIAGIGYAIYKVHQAHVEEQASFDKSIKLYVDATKDANDMADSINKSSDAVKGLTKDMGVEGMKAFGNKFTDATNSVDALYESLGKSESQAAGLKKQLASMPNPSIEQISGSKEASGVLALEAAEYSKIKDRLKEVQDQMKGLRGAIDNLGSAAGRAFDDFNSSLSGVLSSMPSATASITAFNAQVAQSWLKVAQAALSSTKAEMAALTTNLFAAGQRLDSGETGARADADRAMFEKGRKLLGDMNKLKAEIAAQEKSFGSGALAGLVASLTKEAGLTDKVATYNATVKSLQETMAREIKSGGISPENAKKLEALGEKAAAAIRDKGSSATTKSLSDYEKLMQKIDKQTVTYQSHVEGLTAAQLKYREEIAALIKMRNSNGKDHITNDQFNAGIGKAKDSLNADTAADAEIQKKKDMADGMAKLKSITDAANLSIKNGNDILDGATRAQITLNKALRDAAVAYNLAGGAANANATSAYNAAVKAAEGAKATADAVDVAGKASHDLNQAFNEIGKDSSLKKLRRILGNLGDDLRHAMDPKVVKELQKAIDQMTTKKIGAELEHGAENVAAGLTSLQSLAKEGSKAYKEMQVAIDAANLAAAIGAVLNQGMGDPYTAFARMAAMAVAVASLVGDIGSFSGGFTDTAAQRQASQGTGSVLGDSTAKSDSIAKATDITANSTQKLVGINTGMLQALQSLQAGLGSAGGMLAGGAGKVDFSGINLAVKSINEMGKLGGLSPLSGFGDFLGIFSGSHKVTDQGVKILGGKISDLINGTMLQAYEEVQSKSWAFGSKHTKEATGALSDGLGTQFALVIKSITDTVTEASKAIGLPLSEIKSKIAAFQVATTHISLKGLSAADQQKALEAVFSKIFDDLTGAVVPFVKQFQKVGEGLGETLVRVATDVQVMQEAVKQLGISANTTDPEKFAQISVGLAELMGGVDNFITGMTSFVDKFAPDSHKLKVAQDALASALGQVGLSIPPTRDAMWELMQTLDASIPGDQKKISALLKLTDTSDSYYSMLEDANKKLASSAQDLATKLYGTIGTTLDALTAKLDKLKSSTQSALGTALGSNSPLSAKDQLDLALKGLHSGLTTVNQVLSLGKKLYRGADYTKLYQQVMAGQGMGTGSAADVGAQVDQYNALYAKQQHMKAAQDAVSRFNDAKTLAGYVEQMSVNTGKSYSDVAGGLGFNLADLGKDLGVGSITGYLDSLKLNGLSQGESLANISAGTNEQVTLLKSIDQRLIAIESGTSATAANTGKAATQTTANGLKKVASTTRKVSA